MTKITIGFEDELIARDLETVYQNALNKLTDGWAGTATNADVVSSIEQLRSNQLKILKGLKRLLDGR